ncbi:hypothetical protein CHARACLAT_029823 [Characodon lateralis]|uniref:Uncharacterized protein n=1 Tax=Characodon lateralis TaxID=208331 RepID=A0ABU7EEH7_9TELE|nr:hypothetical protein [Characodon lateralis]
MFFGSDTWLEQTGNSYFLLFHKSQICGVCTTRSRLTERFCHLNCGSLELLQSYQELPGSFSDLLALPSSSRGQQHLNRFAVSLYKMDVVVVLEIFKAWDVAFNLTCYKTPSLSNKPLWC